MSIRHQVGERVFVIGFKLNETSYIKQMSIAHILNSVVENVYVDCVLVDNHTKVGSNFEGEPIYDGYTGRLERAGVSVTNQYPMAQYGAFDASGDNVWKPTDLIRDLYTKIKEEDPKISYNIHINEVGETLERVHVSFRYETIIAFLMKLRYVSMSLAGPSGLAMKVRLKALENRIVNAFNETYPDYELSSAPDVDADEPTQYIIKTK